MPLKAMPLGDEQDESRGAWVTCEQYQAKIGSCAPDTVPRKPHPHTGETLYFLVKKYRNSIFRETEEDWGGRGLD